MGTLVYIHALAFCDLEYACICTKGSGGAILNLLNELLYVRVEINYYLRLRMSIKITSYFLLSTT